MTHGKSVNKAYGYFGCWKRSGPTRIKVRIQKEESQRFKDPKEIHGSQRQMKNVGNAWVENRCLRPEGRIMNPIRVEDTDSHPTQESNLDKRQDPCIKKIRGSEIPTSKDGSSDGSISNPDPNHILG